jgi:hypothetical protein
LINPIVEALNSSRKKLLKLTDLLKKINNPDVLKKPNIFSLILICENQLEKITNQFRNIIREIPDDRYQIAMENEIIRIQGIKISTYDNIFKISIPCLLPKKETGNPSYIRTSLKLAMDQFFKNHNFSRYQSPCVIAIVNCYKTGIKSQNMRDHDNIEINAVTDIIALYCLEDDSPNFCDHFLCSKQNCDQNRTLIYIVPYKQFPIWYQSHRMSEENT